MKMTSWIAATLLGSNLALAAVEKLPKFEGHTESFPTAEGYLYKAEDYDKEVAAAQKRTNRTLASENYEDAMSAPYKALRKAILSIHNADHLDNAKQMDEMLTDLAAKMDEIDKKDAANGITRDRRYAGADRDFRFAAASLLPLQCLKGIVWRFTPLAEKSGVVESRLVTAVRGVANSMQIMLPKLQDLPSDKERKKAQDNNEDNVATAVFDYVTSPYNGAVLFAEDFALQEHLYNYCYPAMRKAFDRVERLDFTTPIVWDNKVVSGLGTFPDDLDRYKLMGEAERHVSLAQKSAGMHFVTFFRSYRIRDYFRLQTELAKLYVKDSFPDLFKGQGFVSIEGVSLEKRTNLIRSFTPTFTLYNDGSDILKGHSWYFLSRSVQEWNLAWIELRGKPDNQRAALNPAFFNGSQRDIDEVLKVWMRALNGPVEITSRLTGKKVLFDLKGFYARPDSVPDLKAFLPAPNSFDNSKGKFINHNFKTFVSADGKSQSPADPKYSKYRNWYAGTPTNWNVNAWKVLFPQLTNGEDVPAMMRTVNMGWGGTSLALPLMPFVQ